MTDHEIWSRRHRRAWLSLAVGACALATIIVGAVGDDEAAVTVGVAVLCAVHLLLSFYDGEARRQRARWTEP